MTCKGDRKPSLATNAPDAVAHNVECVLLRSGWASCCSILADILCIVFL